MTKTAVRIFFYVFLFTSFTNLKAQDNTHVLFWGRVSVKTDIKKVESEVEFQYRSQNYYTNNPLAFPLTESMRLWLRYKLNSNLRIGFSPFAFFNQTGLATTDNAFKKHTHELRSFLYFENQNNLNRYSFFTRIGLEAINKSPFNSAVDVRLRLKETLKYPLGEKIVVTVADEVFLNAVPLENKNCINQNRIISGLIYSPNAAINIEGGFMLQTVFEKPSTIINNATIYVNFTFKLLHPKHYEQNSGKT